jgi:hypothetical protein
MEGDNRMRILLITLMLVLLCMPAYAIQVDGFASYDEAADSAGTSWEATEKWKVGNGDVELLIDTDYGEADDEEISNEGSIVIGYDPRMTPSWSIWSICESGFDKLQDIKNENYCGGGPKYIVYQSDNFTASISTGLIYHYLKYRDDSVEENERVSTRLKARYFDDPFELKFVAFHQPSINDLEDDYIIKGEASITHWMDERYGLTAKIGYEHRSMGDFEDELTPFFGASMKTGD